MGFVVRGAAAAVVLVDGTGREVANSSCGGGGGSSSVDRRNDYGRRAAKVNGSSAVSAGCAVAGLELVAGAAALQAWPGGQQLCLPGCVVSACLCVRVSNKSAGVRA